MPVSRVFITRFFQLLAERRFAEAERMLQRSRNRARKNEWNKGYFQALSGLLLAQRSHNGSYLFLPNLDTTNQEELKKHQQDFLQHTRKMTHTDYDRGFFSAWNDYLKTLLQLTTDEEHTPPQEQLKTQETIQTQLL
ncbi:hypothetical protein GWN63_04095 [Candidatus Bathyarchaeota archaeon]|nr:hypothetical protein [Candidatus Bathyarchaeota archaeon]NIU81411.1 hypothetical protein [Candidatus Bathyarchaeota archaeon]NIV68028.1 hypothetical protein [Candidatus Bathyarchaeota archaeon]NIW15910.1 hypothetical protein [Candidatus Bathyarchaeota archaeon]